MAQDVVPADKELRKKIIILLVLVTIAVIVTGSYLEDYLAQIEQQSQRGPELASKKIMLVFKWCTGLVSLLLLCMGIYLILIARRTLRSGQYPPPMMKVIRDTRIRTGAEVKSITTLMFFSSVLLIIFAFLVLCFPWALEKILTKQRSPEIKKIVESNKKGVANLLISHPLSDWIFFLQIPLNQDFSDLDSVECSALPDIVRHNPQVDPIGDRFI